MAFTKKAIKVFAVFLLVSLIVTGGLVGYLVYRINRGAISLNFISEYISDLVDIKGVDFSIGKSSLLVFKNGKFPVQVMLRGVDIKENGGNAAYVENMVLNYAWKDIYNLSFSPGIVDINGVRFNHKIADDNEKSDFDILYMTKEFFSLRKLTLEKFKIKNFTYECFDKNGNLKYSVFADSADFEKLNSDFFEFSTSLKVRDGSSEISMVTKILYNISEGSAMLKVVYKNVNPSQLNVSLIDVLKNLDSRTYGDMVTRFSGLADNKRELHTYIDDIRIKIWGKEGNYKLGKDIFMFDEIFLNLHGNKDLEKITIEDGRVNYGKAQASVKAEITGMDSYLETGDRRHIYMAFHAKAKDLPFDQLPDYWPSVISPEVKNWIKTHMKKGVIPHSEFDLCYKGVNDDSFIMPDIINGSANIYDTEVTYLEGMPPVVKASGLVKVQLDRVDIIINKGNTDNLDVESGTISFYDFDKTMSKADMNLHLAGDVKDALRITDSKPLEYISMLDVDPNASGGKAVFDLKLSFPLKENLTVNEVKVDIKGRSSPFSLRLDKVKLTDGIIDFDINNKRAVLKGDVKINGKSSKLNTIINFEENSKFYLQHKIIGIWNLTDDLQGLLASLDAVKEIKGFVKNDIVITYKDKNSGTAEIFSDLTGVAFEIPLIGMKKQAGKKAHMLLVMNFKDENFTGDADFAYKSSSSLLTARAKFNTEGGFRHIDFSQIKTLKTNVTASVDFENASRPVIAVSGKELNLSHFFTSDKSSSSPNNFKLKAEIAKLWLSEQGDISQVYLLADKQNGIFKKIDFSAVTDERYNPKDVSFLYGNGKISGKIGSLGGFIKVFTPNSPVGMGKAEISGQIGRNGDAKGEVVIEDFIIKDTSLASKILMMASISGIASMRATGIEFNKASFPFSYHSGTVDITDGLIFNLSLGLTVKGAINIDDKTVNVNGTVFPIYWANSLLGRIPLLGSLFAGEKNGGIFGINYSVKGRYPDVEFNTNPLSLLMPGIIRSLFNDIAEGAEAEREKADEFRSTK